MAVFDFPYHKQSTKYPESGINVKLGNSWTFTAPPSAPDRREFTLSFSTMIWNTDPEIFRELNLSRLNAFYLRHKMWAVFLYDHPMFGILPVRFNKPLEIPKGISDGFGSVEGFTIELIEEPGRLATFD